MPSWFVAGGKKSLALQFGSSTRNPSASNTDHVHTVSFDLRKSCTAPYR